jgi:hypothetical protein
VSVAGQAPQHLQGFLLRHGQIYPGKKKPYRCLLSTVRFHHPAQQIVFQDYIHAVTDAEAAPDEFGYLPFSQPGGQLLSDLISKLYENTSLIITTNLTFSDWPQVFADAKMRLRCSIGLRTIVISSKPATRADH